MAQLQHCNVPSGFPRDMERKLLQCRIVRVTRDVKMIEFYLGQERLRFRLNTNQIWPAISISQKIMELANKELNETLKS